MYACVYVLVSVYYMLCMCVSMETSNQNEDERTVVYFPNLRLRRGEWEKKKHMTRRTPSSTSFFIEITIEKRALAQILVGICKEDIVSF